MNPERDIVESSARILVVDDEPEVLDTVTAMLRHDGHKTFPAGSAHQALDLLDREDFDLVITDLKMPEMDGLQLLTEISKLPIRVTTIVLTAHGNVAQAVEANTMITMVAATSLSLA